MISTREGATMNAVSTARTTCRACSSGDLDPILSLGDQYLVRFTPAKDLSLPRSPLNLMRCGACGLLQLEHTVDPDLLFREFWYRSSVNDSMKTALKDIVRTGLTYHHNGTWLDIGANDGYLLSQVPPNFFRLAFEPAMNFEDELYGVADLAVMDYFNIEATVAHRGHCDVITSAAMFYDLDDPNTFVANIAKALSPNGVWINQLNDAPSMLKANAFDAICHEHLCYYDLHSLRLLYEKHGLVILDVTYNDVNGGSMRVVAEKPSRATRSISLAGHQTVPVYEPFNFGRRVTKWRERMTDLIANAVSLRGPIWCYGASTKGCVLLQYLDLNEAFCGIADRNERKRGLFMSGSWLEIHDEEVMRNARPAHVLALPWAFRDEFVKREREMLNSGTTMIFPLPSIEFVL